jgi:hypothetical protein
MPGIDNKSRDYIRENYQYLSDREMGVVLGKATEAVVKMRLAMGIKRAEPSARIVTIDGKRTCVTCSELKPLSEFVTKTGRQENRAGFCKECFNARSVSRAGRLRQEIFDHYGWVCKCCGDSHHECMTLDHIDNDGHKDKFPGGGKITGKSLYSQVIKQGLPDSFQTLCHNCNFGKAVYGICPHKRYQELAERETTRTNQVI